MRGHAAAGTLAVVLGMVVLEAIGAMNDIVGCGPGTVLDPKRHVCVVASSLAGKAARRSSSAAPPASRERGSVPAAVASLPSAAELVAEGKGQCTYNWTDFGWYSNRRSRFAWEPTCVCGCDTDTSTLEPTLLSRIECSVVHSSALNAHAGGHATTADRCQFTNLYQYANEDLTQFVAYCKPAPRFADALKGGGALFRAYGRYHNLIANKWLVVKDPPPDGMIPGGVNGLRNAAPVAIRSVPKAPMLGETDYAYLAAGDCNKGKNPWHCMTGILNFFIVLGLDGTGDRAVTVYHLNGYREFRRGAPMHLIWEGLTGASAYVRSGEGKPGHVISTYAGGIPMPGDFQRAALKLHGRIPEGGHLPVPTWSASWGGGLLQRSEDAGCTAHTAAWVKHLGERVDFVAAPMMAELCGGKHPLDAALQDHKSSVQLIGSMSPHHTKGLHRAETERWKTTHEIAIDPDLVIVFRRSDPGPNPAPRDDLSNPECHRCETNLPAYNAAVKEMYPGKTVLSVYGSKRLNYPIQYYMWRAAAIHITAHSGAQGHYFFMRKPQITVNIDTDYLPLESSRMAARCDIHHRNVKCGPTCSKSNHYSGPMPIPEVLAALKELEKERDIGGTSPVAK